MSFLYTNMPAFYVAAVAATLAWLYGGTRSDLLMPVVPWLMLLVAEVLFIFPQKHAHESTYESRVRVCKAMKRDPLVWFSLLLLVVLAIPFGNTGLCTTCDAAAIAQGARAAAPVPYLPFCVNRMQHLNVVLWFVSALSCTIAVRHALVRQGKRVVLEILVWNAFALAVLGFVQSGMKAPGPLWWLAPDGKPLKEFFSTFGYANMAGSFFTLMFGIAVSVWRSHVEEVREDLKSASSTLSHKQRKIFWRKHAYLIPAAVFFFAAMVTLSRAAILLVSALAAVCFLHAYRSFTATKSRARRLKTFVFCAFVLTIVGVTASSFMPDEVAHEVQTLETRGILDRMTGRQQAHARVASALWRKYPIGGCGGWGYRHFCLSLMTPAEKQKLERVGGMNVHNDYLQFLAEHGAVGCGILALIVILLVAPIALVWQKRVRAARFSKDKDLVTPVQIFALPAPIFCILMTVLAVGIHALGDCPLRSPAILTTVFIALAAMPGFVPTEEVETAVEEFKESFHEHSHHSHHSH